MLVVAVEDVDFAVELVGEGGQEMTGHAAASLAWSLRSKPRTSGALTTAALLSLVACSLALCRAAAWRSARLQLGPHTE